MTTPPFVRFYGNDWFTGCVGMKADERGVYISMCVYIWTTGRRVPLCDAEASRMMGLQFNLYQRIRDKLLRLGKVQKHADGYGIKRAEHELDKASNARSDARPDLQLDAGPAAAAAPDGRPKPNASERSEQGGTPSHSASGSSAVAHAAPNDTLLGTTGGTTAGTPMSAHRGTPIGTCQGSGKKDEQNQQPFIEPDSRTKDMGETRAREGVEVLAHGVQVNCETIRHPSFSISIPAIELGIAGRIPRDEVKRHCVAHALQWAAEIDGGKASASVIPGKIANFLVASIMGDLNRGAAASRRAETDKPRRSLTDVIREREASKQQPSGVLNG